MYSPGYLIARMALGGRLDGVLGFLTRLWLGLTFWIVFAFAACCFGCYRPTVFGVAGGIALATAILASWPRWRWPRDWSFPRRPRFQLGKGLLSGTLTVAIPVLFLLTLVPVMAWDCDTYHLTVPKLYTQAGGFRAIDFNVYSNWPMNAELLYGLAMQLTDWHLANLLHFGIGCATLLAVYGFVRKQCDGYAGLLAAVLFLGNPVVLFEFFVAYVDLAFAFFLFMCFWHLHAHAKGPPGERAHLLLAGIAAGVTAGIKLTGLAAVACVGLWFLLTQWRQGRLRKCVGPFAAMFIGPCLLLLTPWLVKSWYYTGNPVYPFMYDLFGGPFWSSDLATRFGQWQRSIGMGRGLVDYLLLPIRVILFGKIGHGHFDGTINPLWIVWLPLAVAYIRRSRPIGSLLCVSALCFIFWAASSQQMRFLIPILPLVSVAAALAIGDWLARVPAEKSRTRAAAIISAAVVASIVFSAAGGMREGAQFADKDIRSQAEQATGNVRPVLAYINEHLPPTARIMFLNTNHGFFCHREYIADSFFEVSQLADWLGRAETAADLEAMLASIGITHVLWHAEDYHIAFPAVLDEFLVDPARTEPIFCSEDGKDVLYAVVDSALAPTRDRDGDRRGTIMPRIRGPLGMAR